MARKLGRLLNAVGGSSILINTVPGAVATLSGVAAGEHSVAIWGDETGDIHVNAPKKYV